MKQYLYKNVKDGHYHFFPVANIHLTSPHLIYQGEINEIMAQNINLVHANGQLQFQLRQKLSACN